jgi:nucleotide-binding universal stress UspA family protein
VLQLAHDHSHQAHTIGPELTGAKATERSKASATDGLDEPRTIIVGYDGSEPAKRALARAAVLAGPLTRIIVVAAAEPSVRSGITIPANRDPQEIRQRRRELDEARRYLSEAGILAETMLSRGRPADVLLEASEDADLLIVGSRSLNRIERLVLGSVSSKVVHDAAGDVLVVR